MLTYASDIAVMTGAREPGTSREMSSTGSLDHSIWFHRPPAVDDWLLYRTEPVANIGARGLVRGSMHTVDGLLVATVTQEVLLRPTAGGAPPVNGD
jgi:acyl-CoA thioesterase-2